MTTSRPVELDVDRLSCSGGIDLTHGPDAGFSVGDDRIRGWRDEVRTAVRDGMATLSSLVPHVIDELSGSA